MSTGTGSRTLIPSRWAADTGCEFRSTVFQCSLPLTSRSTEVLNLLRHLGCFRNDANLAVGEDGCQSPYHLLACQWDTRQDDGQIIARAPGTFLVARPASFMDTGGLVQRLDGVTSTTLTKLAWAMDRRTEANIGQNFQTWIRRFESAMRGARDKRAVQTQFSGQRIRYLSQFAQLATWKVLKPERLRILLQRPRSIS